MSIGVLLSGGVDSSVALSLLRERGYTEITAFYLKIWLEDEVRFLGDCPWEEDLDYARAVCRRLSIPLEIVSLQTEYYERVVEYALAELRAGRTPSPDIFCNQRIKFGFFAEQIAGSFRRIASGHYAVRRQLGGRTFLARSPDPVKDQTYFLSHQSEAQLERSLFPIGHLEKHEVRLLAERHDLPTASRPDSQGICFLGKIRYPDFVRHYLGEREGKIVDEQSGKTLGSHSGFWFYTIGQRQGLGLSGGPWYVSGKHVDENIVFVTHKTFDSRRFKNQFVVAEPHWINGEPSVEDDHESSSAKRYALKLRHGPEMLGCSIESLGNRRFVVEIETPDPGIAPGQFAVFYRGDFCLGGAKIESA